METRTTGLQITAMVLLALGTCCTARAQDWPDHTVDMPTKLGDITQPEAVPISLTPKRSARPISKTDEELGGIMWGSGPEVQAGVRVRLAGGGTQQSRYLFDVYLRNLTPRSLQVDCAGYTGTPVAAAGSDVTAEVASGVLPVVRDDHGHAVDIGLSSAKLEHNYTIAPGQVVRISHWTAVATDTRRSSGQAAQVGHIEPGNYHIRCEVNAGWADQHAVLTTSKVSFKVIKPDNKQS